MIKRLVTIQVIVLTLILAGCSVDKKEELSEKAKYVKIETVKELEQKESLVYNGYIKEKNLTTLSFRVGGPLNSLKVKVGDFVNNGELIATIDKRDYQLQLNSTKAQYEQLKGEYARYKELYEKDKIPANSYEKIESGFLMAKTAYENAKNQLKDTDLRAPFSGYIHEKFVENYQTVGPGQPILSIIVVSELEVVISIPENQLQKVKKSTRNFLIVENAGLEKLPLEVVSISEKTGTDGLYEMKLSFKNNSSLQISPGMSAEVNMQCNTNGTGLVIPASALFHEGSEDFVWVYDKKSQRIEKREIIVGGIANNGFVKVSSGLIHQELIITAGVHYLFEGQMVRSIQDVSESNVGGLL